MDKKEIIIAIDGHSSTGKSTFARMIASKYGLTYLDTGALYRGVTLLAIRERFILSDNRVDIDSLLNLLPNISFSFFNINGVQQLFLNGESVEKDIRSLDVAGMVSLIASLPQVRDFVNNIIRHLGREGGIVMDGRDIGTVVFPNADLKIFMTASPEVRAQRRYKELIDYGETTEYKDVLKNIIERDYMDEHREVAPLKRADDALLLDNSNMTVEQQTEWVENIISQRWGKRI
jgi:cytidylate kinase